MITPDPVAAPLAKPPIPPPSTTPASPFREREVFPIKGRWFRVAGVTKDGYLVLKPTGAFTGGEARRRRRRTKELRMAAHPVPGKKKKRPGKKRAR